MTTPDPDEFLCLLPDVAPGVRMQAATLLEAEGIPFRIHPPPSNVPSEDLDAYAWTAHLSVYVPRAHFTEALALLRAAWGEENLPAAARDWPSGIPPQATQ